MAKERTENEMLEKLSDIFKIDYAHLQKAYDGDLPSLKSTFNQAAKIKEERDDHLTQLQLFGFFAIVFAYPIPPFAFICGVVAAFGGYFAHQEKKELQKTEDIIRARVAKTAATV